MTEQILADDRTYEIAVTYFIYHKDYLLSREFVPSEEVLNRLMDDADFLGLPASLQQIKKYRDHYYPEEQ